MQGLKSITVIWAKIKQHTPVILDKINTTDVNFCGVKSTKSELCRIVIGGSIVALTFYENNAIIG